MADTKITGLAAGTTLHSDDWLVYVDTHDTTMASTGTDKKLSPAVLTAGLPTFVASGSTHAAGIVPDPGSSSGTTHFLREDATWAVPAGGGGLSSIGNNQILANISGGSAVPIGDTLTAIIDSAISSTQGTLLYRDSSAWLGLAPGTTGQLLASQGASANPHWVTSGGSGTVTSITAGSGLSGGTITTSGTIAISSAGVTYAMVQNVAATAILGNPTGSPAAPSEVTLGPNLAFVGTTLRSNVPIYQANSTGTAITNTTTPTSIFSGVTSVGSLTIPANTLKAGSVIRPLFTGITAVTGTPTVTITISLGGTAIWSFTTAALVATSANGLWAINPMTAFIVQSVGASGKIIGSGLMYFSHNNPLTGATMVTGSGGSVGTWSAPAQNTIDTTSSLAFDIKLTWGTANASSFQLAGGALYLDS